MAIYIDNQDKFRAEPQGISLVCPHCQTLTHLTPQAVPRFSKLTQLRPKNIGIVFRCDACAEPVFLSLRRRPTAPARWNCRAISPRSSGRARAFR